MNFKAMNMFLSESNIKMHLEYMRTLKLRYSVLEKSVVELKGIELQEISRLAINKKIKDEATELLFKIKSHQLFFNSFSESPVWSGELKKNYGSRENFIYKIYCGAQEYTYGFLYVYCSQKKITWHFTNKFDGAFIKYQPLLCLDLFEHTYFNDYFFKKDLFLRSALTYFDTSKLVLS